MRAPTLTIRASWCSRASRFVSAFQARPQRTPGTLFAAMASPLPEPPSTTPRLAREHNDARIVSVGARMHPVADAVRFVDVFLATEFSGEERHRRRLAMVSDYERSGELPPLP